MITKSKFLSLYDANNEEHQWEHPEEVYDPNKNQVLNPYAFLPRGKRKYEWRFSEQGLLRSRKRDA